MAKYSNGTIDNLNIPQSSVIVLESRYLTKDNNGKIIETGEDMLRRVAWDIACADAFYLEGLKEKVNSKISTQELYEICKNDSRIKSRAEEFFRLMSNNQFLPGSPALMNAGRKLQQLSACFVLPIDDSIDKIFDTLKNMAIVHKSGGGTGFSFSRMRPNGAFIHSTGGYSPGPLSFLFAFNESAGQITQGGKRRGANMGIIRANHPDALCFAKVKQEEGVLVNFNLSIAFSDEEMQKVINNGYILMQDPRINEKYTIENAKKRSKEIVFGKSEKFQISWRVSDDGKKIIENETNNIIGKVEDEKIFLEARKLFDIIIDSVWRKGEPGIIFIDKINEKNPTPEIGMIESTNPCGEQPLLPYESCNLGSINLSEVVKEGKIKWELLEKITRSVTRFMDNVIDRNEYPLQEIENMTKANRKIGIGVMGFAHMLVKMKISYNSSEAVEIAEEIMRFIYNISKNESRKIAKEKGAFSNFYKSIYRDEEPVRNSTLTTIAPTGSIGVIASTSQGIEPIYRLITIRNVKSTIGENLIEIDKTFKEYLEEKNLYEVVIEKMKQGKDIEEIEELDEFREEIKKLFVTAHSISPEQHLKIQAAFQKYTDNAVSKTINIPNHSTREDVAKAYFLAYELGCKGVTIYRDGSRDVQLLTAVKIGKDEKNILHNLKSEERPTLIGTTIKQQTPHGKAFITLNCIKNSPLVPYESFINIGKGGRDIPAIAEGFGRLLSISFKNNVPHSEIISQLEGISGETQTGFGKEKVLSLPDAIAKGLKEAFIQLEGRVAKESSIEDEKKEISEEKKISGNLCPDCGGMLMFIEGCQKCSCGYSKC